MNVCGHIRTNTVSVATRNPRDFSADLSVFPMAHLPCLKPSSRWNIGRRSPVISHLGYLLGLTFGARWAKLLLGSWRSFRRFPVVIASPGPPPVAAGDGPFCSGYVKNWLVALVSCFLVLKSVFTHKKTLLPVGSRVHVIQKNSLILLT